MTKLVEQAVQQLAADVESLAAAIRLSPADAVITLPTGTQQTRRWLTSLLLDAVQELADVVRRS